MRSGTFCCDLTVAKKAFFRFWPIWAFYLVLWVVMLPVQALLALQRDAAAAAAMPLASGGVGGNLERFAEFFVYSLCNAGLCQAAAVVFGLLAAMAVCSHLYSTRSANFMGALPARREELFLSHYLSGLAMLILPNLLVFLLTLIIELAGGAFSPVPLAFWLGYMCAADFLFYSFAVCLGMFAGHLLALPVFYGIFNGLAAVVYWMLQWVMERFYYGFSGFAPSIGSAVKWLVPVWKISEVGLYFSSAAAELGSEAARFTVENGHVLAVYTAVALVMSAAAALLYRRRQLETAGDVVAVRAMRPVFKYGVAGCAGLFFGYVTYSVLGTGELGLMVAIVLWAAAGYFVAQMLLDKTFRVLKKWKGAAAVTAAFILLFVVVGFDLTGYENRVPDPAQVVSVEIGGLQSKPFDSARWMNVETDDPAAVANVVDAHRIIVDQRDAGFGGSGNYGTVSLELAYTLTDGSVLRREYTVSYNVDEVNEEGTLAHALNRLLADRALVRQAYGFDAAEAFQAAGGRLTWAAYESIKGTEYYYNEDAQAVLDAVRQDFEAGSIGVRELSDLAWEEQPTVQLCWEKVSEGEERESCFVEIAVSAAAVRTLAALNQ